MLIHNENIPFSKKQCEWFAWYYSVFPMKKYYKNVVSGKNGSKHTDGFQALRSFKVDSAPNLFKRYGIAK